MSGRHIDWRLIFHFEKNIGPEQAPYYAQAYAAFREVCEEALLTAKPMEKV